MLFNEHSLFLLAGIHALCSDNASSFSIGQLSLSHSQSFGLGGDSSLATSRDKHVSQARTNRTSLAKSLKSI